MNVRSSDLDILYDSAALRERVAGVLSEHCGLEAFSHSDDCGRDVRTSSVLLLLGEHLCEKGGRPEACVILNKRSKEVRQPGDLCCPGGSIEKLDSFLAHLLSFRGSSLSRWPCWRQLKAENPEIADHLSLIYATGLREAWEEMGLNPFGLVFLGPLPTTCLVRFDRSIHPLVAWVSRQKRFRLSWEVERIVQFPLRALLNPFNYCHYRMYVPEQREGGPEAQEDDYLEGFRGSDVDFPCFVYNTGGRAELLWGATFRIVTRLLEMIFGFEAPSIEKLPLVAASLGEEYMTGPARNGIRQRAGLSIFLPR
jgi:8-oxo-dGTP pyrophosphatase MutT (NUDIX family)